ncbi:MAG: CGNR zinc finger domain-containing protein, partial [bacterium]|nr:CGNR zinc finger domain-containing protein [bacterium]
FVDRTPGSPRRWCHRNACGSKVNSRRHYHREVKPRREQGKQALARARNDFWQRQREATEDDSEESTPRPAGRRPGGPRVA